MENNSEIPIIVQTAAPDKNKKPGKIQTLQKIASGTGLAVALMQGAQTASAEVLTPKPVVTPIEGYTPKSMSDACEPPTTSPRPKPTETATAPVVETISANKISATVSRTERADQDELSISPLSGVTKPEANKPAIIPPGHVARYDILLKDAATGGDPLISGIAVSDMLGLSAWLKYPDFKPVPQIPAQGKPFNQSGMFRGQDMVEAVQKQLSNPAVNPYGITLSEEAVVALKTTEVHLVRYPDGSVRIIQYGLNKDLLITDKFGNRLTFNPARQGLTFRMGRINPGGKTILPNANRGPMSPISIQIDIGDGTTGDKKALTDPFVTTDKLIGPIDRKPNTGTKATIGPASTQQTVITRSAPETATPTPDNSKKTEAPPQRTIIINPGKKDNSSPTPEANQSATKQNPDFGKRIYQPGQTESLRNWWNYMIDNHYIIVDSVAQQFGSEEIEYFLNHYVLIPVPKKIDPDDPRFLAMCKDQLEFLVQKSGGHITISPDAYRHIPGTSCVISAPLQ